MGLPSLAAAFGRTHLIVMSDPQADLVPSAPHRAQASARPQKMRFQVPTGRDPQAIRQRVEAMETLLERSMTIPGTSYRIGLDTLVGLVPVAGDLITAAMGSYIVWEARNLGLPKWKLWQMVGRLGFDTALGAVPLAGDAFDLLYRSNSKNLRTIKRHLDKHHPQTRLIEQ